MKNNINITILTVLLACVKVSTCCNYFLPECNCFPPKVYQAQLVGQDPVVQAKVIGIITPQQNVMVDPITAERSPAQPEVVPPSPATMPGQVVEFPTQDLFNLFRVIRGVQTEYQKTMQIYTPLPEGGKEHDESWRYNEDTKSSIKIGGPYDSYYVPTTFVKVPMEYNHKNTENASRETPFDFIARQRIECCKKEKISFAKILDEKCLVVFATEANGFDFDRRVKRIGAFKLTNERVDFLLGERIGESDNFEVWEKHFTCNLNGKINIGGFQLKFDPDGYVDVLGEGAPALHEIFNCIQVFKAHFGS